MSALEIRNLRKAFGGLQVISDLDLKVPSGQIADDLRSEEHTSESSHT